LLFLQPLLFSNIGLQILFNPDNGQFPEHFFGCST
jgi:hypothetical protein